MQSATAVAAMAKKQQRVQTKSPIPGLTERQLELVIIVAGHKRSGLQVPSMDDIADLMGCSRPAVVAKVQALVDKGILERDHTHRSLRLSAHAERLVVGGRVPRASPVVACVVESRERRRLLKAIKTLQRALNQLVKQL